MSVLSKFLGNILSPNNWAVFSQLQLSNGVDNGSVMDSVKVTLTSAQIKALNSTPQTLIPAQGAGTFIEVLSVNARLNFGSAQYTGANAVELRYTNGSGAKVSGDLASAWLDAAASALVHAIPAAVTPVANAPVVASVPTANPAVGDSTVTLEIFFRVVTLP